MTLPLAIALRDRNGKFPSNEAFSIDELVNGDENIKKFLPITTGTTLASTCGFIGNSMNSGGPYVPEVECIDEKVRNAREALFQNFIQKNVLTNFYLINNFLF